ncbi:hypothetical protein [Shewanella sedimentimangrovi]|uniref:Uncharacterized protein n=1 Tax=Shewanella sedimentimangrovi TaxID=2814293 RepID=A0ABX7QXR4_9GAMM|nr:hypothetical protein [Shewanella sedimentimangrovi]QSX35608.1 hypothetical protein JYB85_09385 [Shewanella sedimentimangrovi]
MDFLKRIPVYFFEHSRPEFHGAVTVLIYAIVYWVLFLVADLVLRIFDRRFIINYELAGYFVGCIGTGELVRGFTKIYLVKSEKLKPVLGSALAGASLGFVFGFLIMLKWREFGAESLVLWALGGAAFYLLLHWLLYLEAKKRGLS